MSGTSARPSDPPVTAPGAPGLLDPRLLSGLDEAALTAALRPLWEDAGPLARRLLGRPVTTWTDHLVMAEAEIEAMDASSQAELLCAHPRIGADPATLAARSGVSYREQGGDVTADPSTLRRLEQLNEAYEERFGFPFVEWVAGRPKEAIIPVLEARLTRPADVERRAGCTALVRIAQDRLHQLRSGAL